MIIKARVNVETAKKKYAPGETIHEQLPAADMAFLRKHGFVTEEAEDGSDAREGNAVDGGGLEDILLGLGNPGKDGEGTAGGMEYKDEATLKKLNKDEIVAYAKSIGLSLASEMLKSDMIDSVLNHMEEQLAEAE